MITTNSNWNNRWDRVKFMEYDNGNRYYPSFFTWFLGMSNDWHIIDSLGWVY